MPTKEIQELYNEIKETKSSSPSYARYVTAMNSLNEEMTGLMNSTETGWKLLDPETFNSFSLKYRASGTLLETYLHDTEDTEDPAEQQLREKARKISELMAQDAQVFRRYNPSRPENQLSLPSLLEQSRIPTVDISGTKITPVGGAQSSRMPMSIIGPDGKEMPGVFTRATVFDPLGDFNKMADKAAGSQNATPAGADLLRNFASAYKAYYQQNPDPAHSVDTNPEMILGMMLGCRKNPQKSTDMSMSTDKVAAEIAKVNGLSVQEVKTAIGSKGLDAFAKGMSSQLFDVSIKTDEIKMTDKCRIDKKNTGMSIVANMLGVSRVLCHSQSMKIKDKNGKIIDGTFTALAEGVDPNNPTSEARNAGKHSIRDGRGLEDIADLQVLDYICGNVDRHGGNLFYQFDDAGNLIGVQGIDNDSCFGTDVPQKYNERVRCMPVPATMGVISKKTADIIMNLEPSELAFALRGTIDEASIDACVWRLKVMKHNITMNRKEVDFDSKDIKFGRLREYTSHDFDNISKENLNELRRKGIHNHFYEVSDCIGRIANRVRQANEPLSTKIVGETNRATDGGIIGQIKKADQMTKLLKDKTSFWRGSSSENYKDIERAVKEYKELQKSIQQRTKDNRKKVKEGSTVPEDAYGQYVNYRDMKKMKKALLKIKNAADKYASEKVTELADKGKVPDDDKYIKARIDLAKEISQYAEEQLNPSPEEKQSLDSNDRHSLEDYTRNVTKAQKNENRILPQQNESVKKEAEVNPEPQKSGL